MVNKRCQMIDNVEVFVNNWSYRNLCKTGRNRCGFVLFLHFVVVYIIKREVLATAE